MDKIIEMVAKVLKEQAEINTAFLARIEKLEVAVANLPARETESRFRD